MKVSSLFIISFFACSSVAIAHEETHIPKQTWSFDGAFGKFDKAQLQRGFQVFKEVCSTCHSLKRIRFRDLSAIGFSELEIKALAASFEIHDGPNQEGEMFDRKGLPSDPYPWTFKNDNQAKAANNGALPLDLSLIVKARKGGADYIHAFLIGFDCPPKYIKVSQGQYWNKAFPGNLISMAPPLTENQVTYADGTKATIDQMAKDVSAFLAFAAEPEMEKRKQKGYNTLMYLAFLTILSYIVKRRIWKDVH
jgi:ubiquinol-cytochrome c reductase cytochrome c1 subunit